MFNFKVLSFRANISSEELYHIVLPDVRRCRYGDWPSLVQPAHRQEDTARRHRSTVFLTATIQEHADLAQLGRGDNDRWQYRCGRTDCSSVLGDKAILEEDHQDAQ
ncbi:hypothetical protein PPL_10123 [Heterostelium album PN500]|uniref:Uncharacterized protein n=1 Tax=Heterostelium pallidum (strain ATCC 26659 / Pp 5 / PN500) TaxID=670386 RepID=D3BQD8_HETP5|nr:hypothetical protein PPL_10123 [Heterostelium album PN500]EFA76358.1 hypothetical protein PPL_10123 [Heterostelium album PN500]|eukprot:XP_020428490.1 hypothetical protein PPL_10123 [Heterostelium album PN500]